ncbi:hypothetical protein L1987_50139 [Smallanthus sonchifolius]|uniref:Uncharacterized protein n=1 Tax=Smallanthus sonchifolius TaxID=185202 RepID=A0ACB9FWQ2_9ASTR|nr:hypothetical protein L1987_50139 [Smallanthus sonchifolius]
MGRLEWDFDKIEVFRAELCFLPRQSHADRPTSHRSSSAFCSYLLRFFHTYGYLHLFLNMILNLHHTDRPANPSPTRTIMLVETTTAATPARQRHTCKLKSFSDPGLEIN